MRVASTAFGGTFTARDYDHLVDAPVELGTFDETSFQESGATYRIVVDGDEGKDYDLKLYNASGTQLASSTNGSGVAETITYTNSGTSSVAVYLRVYGYNSAYSTTLAYTLKATF